MSEFDLRRLSRRAFMRESLASAAATLGGLAAHDVVAAAKPRKRAGPNDAIRIACVGVHSRGMAHVDGYLGMPDVEVAAICDVDLNVTPRAVKAVEARHGKTPKVYQDLRKLFDDPEIDAVSMALPNHWATLASIWAMQAGKDVYIEKPVSHTIEEGERLAEAASRHGRVCQAGTQSRSHRACQEAIAHIHSGKIGAVHLARGLCYKRRTSIGIFEDGAVPAGVDYDLWLGPAPTRPFNKNRFHYNWHWNWDYGTGEIGNQGVHQMDIARWALGREVPDGVMTVGGRFGYVDQGETPNTLVSLFDYGDRHLIFEVRGLKTGPFTGVGIGDLIYGADGYVAFTDNYGRAAAFDNAGKPITTFSGAGNHFRNFIDAVRSGRQTDLNAPIREGALSSALCHLGNISYRIGRDGPIRGAHPFSDPDADSTYARYSAHLEENGIDVGATAQRVGAPLRFDPRRGRFRGSPDADRLLTRDYRAPYVVPARP